MKSILTVLVFMICCNAQAQSFTFTFNPKKFIQENKLTEGSKKDVIFNLYDINGKETKYNTIDTTSELLRKAKIYSFKGKSEDGTKLITLTIASGKLSGAYLENAKSYFIEPVDKTCKKKYKIYIKPDGDYQVGQPNDFIK
ncbi:hypothetical protein MP478_07725 [Chryseobacterium sp. WG14]|uniref:hypothetical protein n=1 Tax=Chryseobacterium sp. WG14 TaxID=2926909 RepID=UPI00211ED1EA|nr:hypothetical protein [Chryseobacterium sp. WG14]MCQ9639279.1 hypothetical protein [Chryseobacterium sp. WG14]